MGLAVVPGDTWRYLALQIGGLLALVILGDTWRYFALPRFVSRGRFASRYGPQPRHPSDFDSVYGLGLAIDRGIAPTDRTGLAGSSPSFVACPPRPLCARARGEERADRRQGRGKRREEAIDVRRGLGGRRKGPSVESHQKKETVVVPTRGAFHCGAICFDLSTDGENWDRGHVGDDSLRLAEGRSRT